MLCSEQSCVDDGQLLSGVYNIVPSWREDVFCVRDTFFSHFCDIYCSIVLGFDISEYSPEYHVLS